MRLNPTETYLHPVIDGYCFRSFLVHLLDELESFAFPWKNNNFSNLELTFILREVNSFSISALRSSSLSLTVLNSLERHLEVPDL